MRPPRAMGCGRHDPRRVRRTIRVRAAPVCSPAAGGRREVSSGRRPVDGHGAVRARFEIAERAELGEPSRHIAAHPEGLVVDLRVAVRSSPRSTAKTVPPALWAVATMARL